MRRLLLASSASALTATLFAALASCSGEERPALLASDAGTDTALLGETALPEPDAEPPPGDVCGIGTGLQPSAPWPLRGGCSTRAGWSALPGPQNGVVSFSLPALVGETSPAISSSGVVWMGSTDGDILAMTNAGVVRWAHRTGAPLTSSAAIDAMGRAVVGGADGFLYGIAAEDGADDADAGADSGAAARPAKVAFALSVGPIASSPVIGGDGTIYVGTTEGKLVAVASDGSAIKWTVTTNDTFGSSPALGQDGTVHVGSSDGKLYAFTPDGGARWALDVGAPVHGSPAVGGDGTVYVGTDSGALHAVSSAGSERWRYATGAAIGGTPAVYGGAVYVGSEDKKLHAVSTVDGSGRWTYAMSGSVGSPVIDSEGMIYVGAADARVYAITSRGALFFAVNVKGNVKSAPAIGFGPSLYVTTANGLVVIGP